MSDSDATRAEILRAFGAERGCALPCGYPECAVLRWHYGPTAADPDPGKMWCYGCGGEVWACDEGYFCGDCGRWSDE